MMYSVKMRASKDKPHEAGGTHISGAEKILPELAVEETVKLMIKRAFTHTKGKAEFINVKIEKIPCEELSYIPLLKIKETIDGATIAIGRESAGKALFEAGVSANAVKKAFEHLCKINSNMRGAIILDAETGERLDDKGSRGVRVSYMDIADQVNYKKHLEKQTENVNQHLLEALVLASKVVSAEGVLAELCWSDDPEYTTGYVATKEGYTRITPLKEAGSELGGRVFFAKPKLDIQAIINYLEKKPVLANIK